MQLYKQWTLLVIAWVLSSASIKIWPKMASLDLGQKEDLMTALLFKPFHYIISVLFLIFVMMILFDIVEKIIYECKIAFLFKAIPYESLALLFITAFVYWKVIRFYPFLATGLTIVFAIYYLVDHVSKRKKEMIYVREG